MSTDSRFGVYPDQTDGTQQKRGFWANCLIGCLIVFGVLLILSALVAYWVSQHWRGWFADFGTKAVSQGIDASDLPAQEKVEVKEQVERVGTAFSKGEITFDQAGKILEDVMKSPLMPMMTVSVVNMQYLAKSGLSDDEKKEGKISLERYVRGLIDDKIDEKKMDDVMKHIADKQANGQWNLRHRVSDVDLRAALAEAKSQADAAGIPAELENNVDPSDEFKKIIDRELKESAPTGEVKDDANPKG